MITGREVGSNDRQEEQEADVTSKVRKESKRGDFEKRCWKIKKKIIIK